MKKITTALVGLVASVMLLSQPVGAQRKLVPNTSRQGITPEALIKQHQQLRSKYPLLSQIIGLDKSETGMLRYRPMFNRAATVQPEQPVGSGVLKAPSHHAPTALLVNLANRDGVSYAQAGSVYGIYEFDPNAPSVLTAKSHGNYDFNGGGAIVGDYFYGMSYSTSDGYVYGCLYKFNTKTWQLENESYNGYGEWLEDDKLNMLATSTATAPNGTVYGQFYHDANFSQLEFGTVDYASKKRTVIGTPGTSPHVYVAMGISSDGTWYGIANDGKLYTIDKTRGTEKLVGATGVTVSRYNNYGNRFYVQTGAIDQNTNVFYWICIDPYTSQSTLYSVDLQNGHATAMHAYGQGDQYRAMVVAPLKAALNAPAAVSDLSVNFTGGSLAGNVSFTMPSTTYGGDDLTGGLTYVVMDADSTTLATGTAAAGEKITKNGVTVPVEGVNTISVYTYFTSNASLQSPVASVTQYIGNDVPEAPTGVQAEVTGSNSNEVVSLSWTAPANGLNNGYLGALTYDVLRYNGSSTVPDTVKTGITATTYTYVQPKGELANCTYGVVAVNGKQRSAVAKSNAVIEGNAKAVPYEEDFTTQEGYDLFTKIDANQDTVVTELYPGTGYYMTYIYAWQYQKMFQKFAYYTGAIDHNADDWLITPKIHLEQGKTYEFTIAAQVASGGAGSTPYPHRVEVKMGTAPTVEAMATHIMDSVNITNYNTGLGALNLANYSNYGVTVPATGDYYFGIHAISDPGNSNLLVKRVIVREANVEKPKAVTNLTVKPDATGALVNTVSFTAPAQKVDGSKLTSNVKVIVYRMFNGQGSTKPTPYKTFDSLEPGAQVSFNDTVKSAGNYTYNVVTYLGDNEGEKAWALSRYTGLDKPSAVTGIKEHDNLSSVLLTWNKVSAVGANGGVVLPDDVAYRITPGAYSDNTGGIIKDGDALVTDLADTRYDAAVEGGAQSGEQGFKYWVIEPHNSKGYGTPNQVAAILTGKPYALPHTYTKFDTDDNNAEGYFLYDASMIGDSDRGGVYGYTRASDGDGKAMAFIAYEPGETALLGTGKISIDDAAAPRFYFDVLSSTASNVVKVSINTPDAADTIVVPINEAGKYERKSIDLSKYAGAAYVIAQVNMQFTVPGVFAIDNMNVVDGAEKNLAVSYASFPASMTVGDTKAIKVTVRNYGTQPASNYVVKLTDSKNRIVYADTVEEALPAMSVNTITVNYKPDVFTTGALTIKAEVTLAGETATTDNTVSQSVNIKATTVAKPTAVKAVEQPDGTVAMSWTAPNATSTRRLETFDGYKSWIIDDIGNWTVVNNTGSLACPIFANFSLPHDYEPYAYIVSNFDDYGGGSAYPGHSGYQYLSSVVGLDADASQQVRSDNWLISPLLDGTAQTITFYAINHNTSTVDYPSHFKVLYSSTDKQLSSFKELATGIAEVGEWMQFKYQLPEGTRYFAVENTEEAGQGLWFGIDDISFVSGTGAPVGYRIYVDGTSEPVGEASELSYAITQKLARGAHSFAVTAVYYDGTESVPVSVSLETSGIDKVVVDDSHPVDIYSIDGKLIRRQATSTAGLKGVYIVGNQKVLLK